MHKQRACGQCEAAPAPKCSASPPFVDKIEGNVGDPLAPWCQRRQCSPTPSSVLRVETHQAAAACQSESVLPEGGLEWSEWGRERFGGLTHIAGSSVPASIHGIGMRRSAVGGSSVVLMWSVSVPLSSFSISRPCDPATPRATTLSLHRAYLP